jgi:hypothetical protein
MGPLNNFEAGRPIKRPPEHSHRHRSLRDPVSIKSTCRAGIRPVQSQRLPVPPVLTHDSYSLLPWRIAQTQRNHQPRPITGTLCSRTLARQLTPAWRALDTTRAGRCGAAVDAPLNCTGLHTAFAASEASPNACVATGVVPVLRGI